MKLNDIFESKKCFISNIALQELIRFTLEYKNIETGGDLFGLWDDKGNPIISCIIGPGVKAKRTTVSFNQDMEFLREQRNIILKEKNLIQIGMWHSHHRMDLKEPSSGDVNSIKNNLTYETPRMLLLICNIDNQENVLGHPYLFNIGEDYKKLELKNTFKYRIK